MNMNTTTRTVGDVTIFDIRDDEAEAVSSFDLSLD